MAVMNAFGALSKRQQIARLRVAALRVVQEYPIEVERIRLVQLGFNAAFSVHTTNGRRYALRINVNSHRTLANLNAEVAWLTALAADTDLQVPRPVARKLGGCVAYARVSGMEYEMPAVLFEWIDGRTLGEEISAARARQIGRSMAQLHQHAAGYELPAGAELPDLRDFLWNQPDRLSGNQEVLGDEGERVIRKARERSEAEVNRLMSATQLRVIHADLHGWNIIAGRGRVSIIDFDDTAMGTPVQDIGVSGYYQKDYRRYLYHLYAGYAEVLPVPAIADALLHAMFAQRNIIMLNDLLATQSAELAEMIPQYVPRTVTRLHYYLETGEFAVGLG